MTKEAADRVKQIREYLSKMTPGEWCNPSPLYDEIYQFDQHKHVGRMVSTDDAKGIAALRTDAEWLLSQLSASEERVRALEKWLTELGYPPLLSHEEQPLPSPPQVIRG